MFYLGVLWYPIYYRAILGTYEDNGKEMETIGIIGSYCILFGDIRVPNIVRLYPLFGV